MSDFVCLARIDAALRHDRDLGVQSAADVQQQVIQALERYELAVILRESRRDNVQEPNKSAESSEVTLLDWYFDQSFRRVQAFGPITIH